MPCHVSTLSRYQDALLLLHPMLHRYTAVSQLHHIIRMRCCRCIPAPHNITMVHCCHYLLPLISSCSNVAYKQPLRLSSIVRMRCYCCIPLTNNNNDTKLPIEMHCCSCILSLQLQPINITRMSSILTL